MWVNVQINERKNLRCDMDNVTCVIEPGAIVILVQKHTMGKMH